MKKKQMKSLHLNKVYVLSLLLCFISHNFICRYVYHSMLEDYTDCGATGEEEKKGSLFSLPWRTEQESSGNREIFSTSLLVHCCFLSYGLSAKSVFCTSRCYLIIPWRWIQMEERWRKTRERNFEGNLKRREAKSRQRKEIQIWRLCVCCALFMQFNLDAFLFNKKNVSRHYNAKGRSSERCTALYLYYLYLHLWTPRSFNLCTETAKRNRHWRSTTKDWAPRK